MQSPLRLIIELLQLIEQLVLLGHLLNFSLQLLAFLLKRTSVLLTLIRQVLLHFTFIRHRAHFHLLFAQLFL
jgi:hypothetical protein